MVFYAVVSCFYVPVIINFCGYEKAFVQTPFHGTGSAITLCYHKHSAFTKRKIIVVCFFQGRNNVLKGTRVLIFFCLFIAKFVV